MKITDEQISLRLLVDEMSDNQHFGILVDEMTKNQDVPLDNEMTYT